MYKVKVNKEKCIGCGACVAICPEVFELKAGKAIVKKAQTNKECAKQAADSCPVNAITIN
jgi:ferredoxin